MTRSLSGQNTPAPEQRRPGGEPRLVSVVVPAFNACRWIGEAIDSVIAQTYTEYEIIVIDDGSTDNTADVVSERYGSEVRCVRQENAGLPAARNTGLRLARGEYVQFLDADDLLLPEKIERHVTLLEQRPDASLVYCDFAYLDPDGAMSQHGLHGHFSEGSILRPLLRCNFIVAHAAMARTAAVREVGGFDEELQACEDYDLWLRLAVDRRTFLLDDRVLVLYRRTPGSMSSQRIRQADGTIEVLRRALKRSSLGLADKVVLVRHLAGLTAHRAVLATQSAAQRWSRR